MKKYIFSLALSLVLSALAAGTSNADVSCQPIYGGGQTCTTSANVSINKTVQDSKNGQFVDNLSINNPRFSPDQTVNFQISVTNTGSSSINRLIVKDTLPQYVNFVSGPGSFDSNSKTLSFETDNLPAGETRTFSISGKIATDSALINGSGVVCVVNQAWAQIVSTGQVSQDNSQFCIQKGVPMKTKGGLAVLPAPKMTITPPTGPEMVVLPLLGGSGVLGWLLRRKSTK